MKQIAAIIPAAGRGSRLLPFPCPKELFPVGYQDVSVNGQIEKRPKVVSQYLLEHLVEAGAKKLFVILGEGKFDIMRYYGDGARFGADISYLYQEELRGMPSAIDLARPWLKDETVLFGMPDTIIEPADCFARLLAHREASRADLTLALFRTDNPSKFGMVEFAPGGKVVHTIDKPRETDLEWMWGAACWSPAFTELMGAYLKSADYGKGEIVLGDVFNHALAQKMAVTALPFADGRYIDIGTTSELNSALRQFHL